MPSRKNQKFYVVWKGARPGIYTTWPECQSAINGASNAKYKFFCNNKVANRVTTRRQSGAVQPSHPLALNTVKLGGEEA
ncbi:MAG: viroplasmin family protein [bacterium]